jgi:hypothetical protein
MLDKPNFAARLIRARSRGFFSSVLGLAPYFLWFGFIAYFVEGNPAGAVGAGASIGMLIFAYIVMAVFDAVLDTVLALFTNKKDESEDASLFDDFVAAVKHWRERKNKNA